MRYMRSHTATTDEMPPHEEEIPGFRGSRVVKPRGWDCLLVEFAPLDYGKGLQQTGFTTQPCVMTVVPGCCGERKVSDGPDWSYDASQ